ncbi:MAG: protein-glutamate O-methyltransferase CheR [Acidobacteriota bacterium]
MARSVSWPPPGPDPEGSSDLSDVDFVAIRNVIYDACGVFCDNKVVLKNRLVRRMEALGIGDARRYYLFLKYDGKRAEELEHLLQEVLVHETYFLREQNQLRAFADEILPGLAAPGRPIKIWCAGCSSGEEPYTIAMILEEQGVYDRAPVALYATDISARILARARQGLYTRNSFRGPDLGPYRKYFDVFDPGGDRFGVKEDVRRRVLFKRHNLLDEATYNPLLGLDVVLCRNVMIYFDRAAKKKVVRMFHDRLKAGGYLLLGHAESLTGMSEGFRLERLKNDLVYRKI